MSQQISIGQIIDKTFHVYQKHFLAYAKHGMWLFVTLPLSILILEPIVHLFSDNIFTIAIIVAIAMLVNFVVAIIMGNFVSNGFIFATDAFDKEKPLHRQAYKKARGHALAACGQSVVLFVILALAALLLIPGLGLFMSSSYTETPGVVLPRTWHVPFICRRRCCTRAHCVVCSHLSIRAHEAHCGTTGCLCKH